MFVVFLLASKQMPVYSLYSFHRTFIPAFEYLTPSGFCLHGSRGVAQAKKIKEQTIALFAGGELSEEDQAAFIKEMEALFLDAKSDAKKFTPKKYLR